MKNKIISILVLFLIIVVSACNMPQASPTSIPGLAFTQAAETVSAIQTGAAPSATVQALETPTTIPPSPTNTLFPTNTPPPTTGPTLIPCNMAKFGGDITITDGTAFAPNATFTKTWRITNVGSCTWTSGYKIIFDSGDKMGGPDFQILTPGTVAPGQTLDVSVDLTAPATAGAYRGYWKLKDPTGIVFSLTSGYPLWVDIVVTAPATTVTLNHVAASSGSVRSDGTVLGVINVGDTGSDVGSQVFLTFDISGIPSGSVVTVVKLDFSLGYDILGNPFGGLDCLRVYHHKYDSLDAGDYSVGLGGNFMNKLCSASDLNAGQVDNDYITTLQSRIGKGTYQIRLQFEKETNSDGIGDMVRLGTVKLTVSYIAP